MNNPYKRNYSDEAKYFVIHHHKDTKEGWSMMTSAGFDSYADAQKYVETINPCWKPKIVKLVESAE